MSRPPRVFESGFCYHVVPKGNDGRAMLTSDEEREAMWSRCDRSFIKYDVEVVTFCFLDNHLHFIIRAGTGDVSRAIQELQCGYAHWWNKRHGRRGHVFENHFFERKLRTEQHLYSAIRYIALNPVVAGIVATPEEWPWGSYRAQVGLDVPPRFLATAVFLDLFGGTAPQARASFEQFVREGLPPRP